LGIGRKEKEGKEKRKGKKNTRQKEEGEKGKNIVRETEKRIETPQPLRGKKHCGV